MRKLKTHELKRLTVEAYQNEKKIPVRLVLDNIRSANNVGSIFRTSDALLIEQIYLCGITATPPNRDIQKTALGASDTVAWQYFSDTEQAIRQLKNENYNILAIEQCEKSTLLQDFQPEAKQTYALIFGHEVKGVSQKIVDQCDGVLEIPQYGTKHSFNVAVSAGIVLWDVFQKLYL